MKRPALVSLLSAALVGCGGMGEVRTLGRYDFSYRIEGDARVAPLQIFDDGQQTYFQFREAQPAIFAINGDKQLVIVAAQRDGSYVVASRIEREFVFLLDGDKSRAGAKYIGKQNRMVLPQELAALRDPDPAPAPQPPTIPLSHQVPFEAGSARLDAASQHALDQLLPPAMTAKGVVILANPVVRGGDRGISLMRGVAVRTWLVQHGIGRRRIVIKTTAAVLARDHCEVQLVPAESPKDSTLATTDDIQGRKPALYGAAQPIATSTPAQPRLVDRDVGMASPNRLRP